MREDCTIGLANLKNVKRVGERSSVDRCEHNTTADVFVRVQGGHALHRARGGACIAVAGTVAQAGIDRHRHTRHHGGDAVLQVQTEIVVSQKMMHYKNHPRGVSVHAAASIETQSASSHPPPLSACACVQVSVVVLVEVPSVDLWSNHTPITYHDCLFHMHVLCNLLQFAMPLNTLLQLFIQ